MQYRIAERSDSPKAPELRALRVMRKSDDRQRLDAESTN
jgi:hypothetical protein